ncbi:MAG: teichoic acid D-Ala incorporation-associated protein DltX [Ruminococcaceae bacterium]|nr:teichoic acid D-Ala incorporation-associated protein DltX [Oscillospiraceae bacterium]
MKKLMSFITNLTETVYRKSYLRIMFYIFVIIALVALYLFTDGQKIEFVYNDF